MRKYAPILLLSFLLTISFSGISQNGSGWLRYPAISPDGKTILFNYKGDIYKVPTTGGTAIPITLSDSYEYAAVWSNDGKNIAFASNRYGNFDVFVISAEGGNSKRLTFHSGDEKPSSFTIDKQKVVFTASRQDLHTNVQFPSGVMAELYSVPIAGGRVSQVLTTPAHDAVFSSDGKKLLFHDRKGYENDWRKHHTSAVTRDIWVYDMESKKYQQLSQFNGEDRNPVFAANNDDFYYLTEESGSFNIHKSSVSNPTKNTPITTLKKHPVRFLTSSEDNLLCFSYDGDIFTLVPGNQPIKVEVQVNYDGRETLNQIVPVDNGFTEASLSSNGKEYAYVFRGEIFVSSVEYGTTKRITNTPWQERSVSFSPDGKSLVYAAEKENSWNIYTQTILRQEEAFFYLATTLKEETLVATTSEEFQPLYSPDGKEVAYLENRTTLKVLNLASKQSRTVMAAENNYSYADGDQWYQWSPDSKWFLVRFGPKEDIFQSEVGLVEASGNGTIRNLTLSGYDDYVPKWAMDGKMVIWGSTREGTKAEAGYHTSGDVYGMFFTKEAFDRFNLSKEAFELIKEKEDKAKKDEEKEKEKTEADKKDKKAKKDSSEIKKVEDLKFDWDNLTDRKQKLTIHTSEIADWILSKEGEKLYYLTSFEDKNNLWVTDLRTKETKEFAKIDARNTSMELSSDGKFIFVLADGKPMKVEIKEGKTTPIKANGEMLLKPESEREYIFEHSWRQVREKFYVKNLQGTDWDFYHTAYKKFLPYINNNYDFTEMLSEMLGELNASHTGSGYRANPGNSDETASLGALYDYSYTGDGLKIAEVLLGGPLTKATSKVAAGNIIEKINGEAVTPSIDFYQLLNRTKNKNTLLSLYNPSNKERWEEVVVPISLGAENQLLYKWWVKTRQDEVARLSNGKLGYVHVRGMNDASMRTVYEEALGKYIGAEALIVDTRFNGGGNLHDVLSDFLNGKKYIDVIPHGQYIGSEPSNKWTKPSIVVMGESNYSDAHLFPVAYKIKGVGKTLGMPVPGTGTFVWWETQIDPTIYFGIPMGGWKPLGQPFLENNQLEPDIKVRNEPDIMGASRDQQLEEAVKELMKK